MVTKVDAYEDWNGLFHKTRESAERAEIEDAITHIVSLDVSHLRNVMMGSSTNETTRRAIVFLAEQLPPDAHFRQVLHRRMKEGDYLTTLAFCFASLGVIMLITGTIRPDLEAFGVGGLLIMFAAIAGGRLAFRND